VKKKVIEMIRGRTLVAYHVHLKLTDLGMWSPDLINEEALNCKCVDIATVFNRSLSEQQRQMKSLCKDHLNLDYKKRPFPFAVNLLLTNALAH